MTRRSTQLCKDCNIVSPRTSKLPIDLRESLSNLYLNVSLSQQAYNSSIEQSNAGVANAVEAEPPFTNVKCYFKATETQ